MDFHFDDDTRMLVDALQKFLDKEVLPLEREHADAIDGGKVNDAVHEIGAGIRTKAVEAGFYNAHIPTELGGGGLPHVTLTALRETIARSGSVILAVFVIGDPPMGPTPMLMLCDEDQKERYVRPLMRGEVTTCFALTEPNAGSDVNALETTTVRDGDDYVLNGSKIYISNGLHCDFLQVFAVTEKGKGMAGGISLFLVDADTPGISRTLMRSMGGDDFQAEIGFDDVRVPAANRVGEEGYGFLGAAQWLSGERLMMAIQAGGAGRVRPRPRPRTGPAPARPSGRRSGTTRGSPFPSPTGRPRSRPRAGSPTGRPGCSTRVTRRGRSSRWPRSTRPTCSRRRRTPSLQTLGGIGYMTEHPIERIYRMARVFRIGGGDVRDPAAAHRG